MKPFGSKGSSTSATLHVHHVREHRMLLNAPLLLLPCKIKSALDAHEPRAIFCPDFTTKRARGEGVDGDNILIEKGPVYGLYARNWTIYRY